MSFQTEKATIEGYVRDNLIGPYIAFENMTQPNTVSEWIRVNVLNATGRQITLGNNPYYRYSGLVIFQVFTKLRTGSGRATAIADQITTLFRGQRVNGITFNPPTMDKIGDAGEWYQVNVSVPFFREEV